MNSEAQRVISGPRRGQVPGALGLLGVRLTVNDSSDLVLQSLREVLSMIFHCAELAGQSLETSEFEAWTSQSWREAVYARLESWFFERSPGDSGESGGREYLAQLFSERDWEWWSAKIVDDQRIDLEVLVLGFPISGFDALRWICHRCGVTEVVQLKG